MVERLFDSSLVGLMGARLEPVEIAKRLSRAMEAERMTGTEGPIAPNGFTVRMSELDYGEYESIRGALERELESYLTSFARERQLRLLAGPVVSVEVDPGLRRHQVAVVARMTETSSPTDRSGRTERFAAIVPAAEAVRPATLGLLVTLTPGEQTVDAGVRVDRDRFAIGRALDNQYVLEDTSVSRYHAAILLDDAGCSIRDLDSTNGTWVNGRRVREKRLLNGDVVSLGGAELRVSITKDVARERE
jgi:hypothetical protein